MRARGDFGNDAAVRRVRLVLRGDALGKDRPVGTHQGGGGLVARALDAKDYPHPGFP